MKTEKRKGAICILDALGFSSITKDKELIAADLLRTSWNSASKIKLVTELSWSHLKCLERPEIQFFSDTVIIAVELNSNEMPESVGIQTPAQAAIAGAFRFVSLLQSSVLTESMSFLYRGAVSFGDFVHTKRAILGPAVIEAASFYEKPSGWFVIAAPSCLKEIALDAPLQRWPQNPFDNLLTLTNVPINDSGSIHTYALNPLKVATPAQKRIAIEAINCMAKDHDPRVMAKARNTYVWLDALGEVHLTQGRK